MLNALAAAILVAHAAPSTDSSRPIPLAAPWIAFEQDPAGQPPDEKPDKKAKKDKKEKQNQDEADKPKKKKRRNNVSDDEIAPDEERDLEAPDTAIVGTGNGPEFGWKQHPAVTFGSVLRIEFTAKFQEDGHQSYPDAVALGLTPWELHRNRVGIKGKLFTHIRFEVERELTETELTDRDILLGLTPKPMWKDVNVDLSYFKKAQIQVGKFKVPFGLDELTSVSHNDYVYRSLGANYLDPGRDIGAQVHGSYFKHGFTYAAGVFVHDGDNARSKKIEGGNQTFATRLTFAPFRRMSSALGNIDVGTAYAISALSDDSFRPNGLRGRTVLTQDTFYDTVYVKGRRRRWEADADYTVGPASLRGEFTWVSDDRQGQGLGDQDLPDARARSWYVSGTWILTGEDKRRPVKAERRLLQGGIGAVEVAARIERMWFDSTGGADAPFRNPRAETIYPSGDRVLTLGVNWTLNRFMKIQVNGMREHVEDPDRNPVPNGAAFWSRVLRLQFVL